jgi:hypothetical protein
MKLTDQLYDQIDVICSIITSNLGKERKYKILDVMGLKYCPVDNQRCYTIPVKLDCKDIDDIQKRKDVMYNLADKIIMDYDNTFNKVVKIKDDVIILDFDIRV